MRGFIWEIRLFGGLTISQNNAPAARPKSTRDTLILAALCARLGKPTPRDHLAFVAWPEANPEKARQSLRQSLSNLRKILEPAGTETGTILQTPDRETVILNSNAVWADVDEFNRLISRANKRDNPQDELADLWQAVSHYQGDFLSGFYDEWVWETRLRYQSTFEALLQTLRARNPKPIDKLLLAFEELKQDPEDTEILSIFRAAIADSNQTQATSTEATPQPKGQVFAPHPITTFFGREQELAQIIDRLAQGTRLLTLVAPGGFGKTRLSLTLAQHLGELGQNSIFVPCRDVPDSSGIESALTLATGNAESALVQIENLSGNTPLTLILDNAEDNIPAIKSTAERWLRTFPNLHIIVTSRYALESATESIFTLNPLPTFSETPDEFNNPSLRLLVDRIRSIRPTLTEDSDTVELINHICRIVDGIPLALELIARRARTQSIQEIHDSLNPTDDELPLNQVVRYSLKLLGPTQSANFTCLSQFHGSFTHSEAKAITSNPQLDLTDAIRAGLLQQTETEGQLAYRMLSTIREIALENRTPEDQTAFVNLLQSSAQTLTDHYTQGQIPAFRTLARRILIDLDFAIQHANLDEADHPVSFAHAMAHMMAGSRSKGFNQIDEFLTRFPSLPPTPESERLRSLAGTLAIGIQNPEQAIHYFTTNLNNATNPLTRIKALANLGTAHIDTGSYGQSLTYLEEAQSLITPETPAAISQIIRINLSTAYELTEQPLKALALCEDLLEEFEGTENYGFISSCNNNIADAWLKLDRPRRAFEPCFHSIAAAIKTQELPRLALALDTLAEVFGRRKDKWIATQAKILADTCYDLSGSTRSTPNQFKSNLTLERLTKHLASPEARKFADHVRRNPIYASINAFHESLKSQLEAPSN